MSNLSDSPAPLNQPEHSQDLSADFIDRTPLAVGPNLLALLHPERQTRHILIYGEKDRYIERSLRNDRTEISCFDNWQELEAYLKDRQGVLDEQVDLAIVVGQSSRELRIDATWGQDFIRRAGYTGPLIGILDPRSSNHHRLRGINEGIFTTSISPEAVGWQGNTLLLSNSFTAARPHASDLIPAILAELEHGQIVDGAKYIERIQSERFRGQLGVRPNLLSGPAPDADWILSADSLADLTFGEFLAKAFNLQTGEKLSITDVACGDLAFLDQLTKLDNEGRIERSAGIERLKVLPHQDDTHPAPIDLSGVALKGSSATTLFQKEFFQRFNLITCNAPVLAYAQETMEIIPILAARQGALALIRLHWDDHRRIDWYGDILDRWGYSLIKTAATPPKDYPSTRYVRGNEYDRTMYIFAKTGTTFLDSL